MKKIIILSIIYILITLSIILYTANIPYIHIPVICKLLITAIPFCLYVFKTSLKNNLCSNIDKNQKISLIIFSILMSLFLIYSFNIYKHNPPIPVEFEISTTHTKPEASHGYNISLYSIKFDDKIINIDEAEKIGEINKIESLTKNYYNLETNSFTKFKYYIIIDSAYAPSKIKIKGKADKIFIIFNANPYDEGGYAQVKINDKKYEINSFQPLYNPDENGSINSGKAFSFEVENKSIINKIFKFIYIFSYFLVFVFSFYYIGYLIIQKSFTFAKTDKKITKLSILLYASPILLSGIFYLLVFYPGIMPFDCLIQWHYAHTLHFSTEHPVFHTFIIYFLSSIWDSPACIVIVQIIYLSFITGYFFYKLRKLSIPSYILFIISTIIAITPYVGITLATLWKDVFFSIALYALTLCTLFFFIEKQVFLSSKLNCLIFITSLIMMVLTRYNGIFAIILYLLILILFIKPLRTKIIKLSLISSFCIITILNLINNNINIYHQTFIHNQVLQVPIHQILCTFHHKRGGGISSENKAVLATFAPLYKWENNYFKYIPHEFIYRSIEMIKNPIPVSIFIKTYLNILKSNYMLMFKDILIINSYILKYKINPEGFNYAQRLHTRIDIDDPYTLKFLGYQDLHERSYLPELKSKFNDLIKNETLYELFYKPTPYFIIFLLFGSLFIIKNGLKTIIIYTPIILTLLFLTILIPEMCTRYVFILFLIYPIVILLSFIKMKNWD